MFVYKNKNGITLRKRCYTCENCAKNERAHGMSAIHCRCTGEGVQSDWLCGKWVCSKDFESLGGRIPGRIKRREYLQWFVDRGGFRCFENKNGEKVCESVGEVRREYEMRSGEKVFY